MAHNDTFEPALEARRLLRGARNGTLATVTADCQPFASLVTPACAPDGSILLLLSDLAEHTRHLRDESRCAVLVTGTPEGTNPQTTPRLTVTGVAALENEPALRARWLALHPYAALYAGFSDFRLWRIRPGGALFVAGFGRAAKLGTAALAPAAPAVDAIAAAEARIIAHCNADHADALADLAEDQGARPAQWRMVAVDADGCDLAAGEKVCRLAWSRLVADSADVRRELVALFARANERRESARKGKSF